MIYVMFAFWLIVSVFAAQGVYHFWTQSARRKWVNALLLPGTLTAQLGFVLGTLITGGTVTQTKLFDDHDGESESSARGRPRFGLIGAVVAAMVPVVLCVVGIAAAARYVGGSAIHPLFAESLDQSIPLSAGAFWNLFRDQVSLMEEISSGLFKCDLGNWRVLAFAYLLVCFSIRLASPSGESRHTVFAIVLMAVGVWVYGQIFASLSPHLETGWRLLSLVAGVLSLLLVATLLARAIVRFVKIVTARTP